MSKRLQTPPRTKLTAAEYVAKHIEMRAAQARESFYWFRRLIRPQMLTGWWTDNIEAGLQKFYEDFMAGRRPKLAMGAPPQHGKSLAATDFTAWVAGKNPDRKTIFGSYSDELGMRTNLDVQRIIKSPNFQLAFPHMQIDQPGWVCNSELIEYVGHAGSFRNTTVRGAVNGLELHLGIIDDPVKGRQEAYSKPERDRTWGWFTDDFLSRFAKDSAMLIIMTRWHVDDLLGRYIDRMEGIRVLSYPAIAENDTQYRKAGEALFPELKPLEFLEERRKILSHASWQAQYQQHPIVVGGGVIPIEKLRVMPFFDRSQVQRSVRYIDKAGTQDGGAWTACVLMHRMRDRTYVIGHVARGQWGVLEREQKIKTLVEADARLFGNYEVGIEQEPGSGGKESAQATVRNLAGKRVFVDKVTGSKETRAEPLRNARTTMCGWSPVTGFMLSSMRPKRGRRASTRTRSMPAPAPSTAWRRGMGTTPRMRAFEIEMQNGRTGLGQLDELRFHVSGLSGVKPDRCAAPYWVGGARRQALRPPQRTQRCMPLGWSEPS